MGRPPKMRFSNRGSPMAKSIEFLLPILIGIVLIPVWPRGNRFLKNQFFRGFGPEKLLRALCRRIFGGRGVENFDFSKIDFSRHPWYHFSCGWDGECEFDIFGHGGRSVQKSTFWGGPPQFDGIWWQFDGYLMGRCQFDGKFDDETINLMAHLMGRVIKWTPMAISSRSQPFRISSSDSESHLQTEWIQ